MIKGIVWLAALIILSTPADYVFAGDKSVPRTEAIVTALQGTAKAFRKGASAGRMLKKGDRLAKNHEIRVGKRSRVELRFPDGTIMRLSESSRLVLNEVLYTVKTADKSVKVKLGVGKLWATVKELMTPDSSVEVRTTNAVAGVRGTIYRVNVEDDKSAMIKVYDGSVYVANPPHDVAEVSDNPGTPHEVPGPQEVPTPYHEVTREDWTAIVQAMQQISISAQGVPSKPESFDPKADTDDWVRWNQERDRQVHF